MANKDKSLTFLDILLNKFSVATIRKTFSTQLSSLMTDILYPHKYFISHRPSRTSAKSEDILSIQNATFKLQKQNKVI